MKIEIPNAQNPFHPEQSELAIAWELGWYHRNNDFIEHIAEGSKWAVDFRRQVRDALYPYYPSNPCSTDNELLRAIRELAEEKARKKRGKST